MHLIIDGKKWIRGLAILLVAMMAFALAPPVAHAANTSSSPSAGGQTHYTGGRFYYEALANKPMGAKLQAFYDMLVPEAEALHQDFTTNFPETVGETYSVYKRIDIRSLQIPRDYFTDIDGRGHSWPDMLDIAANAFFHDNMQYLFLQPNVLVEGSYQGNFETATLFLDNDAVAHNYDYRLAADRRAHMDMVDDTFAKYQALTSGAASSYEKARLVHDQIVTDWDYAGNTGSPYAGLMIGAMGLSDAGIVCRGYSTLYSFIMNNLGVPTAHVGGSMTNESGADIGGHAWNLVLMDDGKYYYTDLTWADDQTTDDDVGNFQNPVRYRWFLRGGGTTGEFSKYHSTSYFDLTPYETPANIGTANEYDYKNIHSSYKFLLDVPGNRASGYDLGTFRMPASGQLDIRPKYFDDEMELGRDYDIRVEQPLALGKNRVWFIGKGAYRGVDIGYVTLADNTAQLGFSASLPKEKYEYTGDPIEPDPIVKNGSCVLEKGVDYTVSYQNNIAKGGAGARVNVVGMGDYQGRSQTVSFEIFARYLDNKVTPAEFQSIYSNGVQNIAVLVLSTTQEFNDPVGRNNRTLELAQAAAAACGIDLYIIDYAANLGSYGFYNSLYNRIKDDIMYAPLFGVYKTQTDFSVSAYEIWASGGRQKPMDTQAKIEAIISQRLGATSPKTDIGGADIRLSFDRAGYTGSEIKPAATVTFQSQPLVEGRDYVLKYFDNIKPGVNTATVSVIGKGRYTASKAKPFTILADSSSGGDTGTGGGDTGTGGGGTNTGVGGGTGTGSGGGANTGVGNSKGKGNNPGGIAAPAKVTGLSARKKTIRVKSGKTVRIPFYVYATAAGKQTITWRSSKPRLASPKLKSKTGQIIVSANQKAYITVKTAKNKIGKVKITLITQDGRKLIITVKVIKKKKRAH
ncbi:MAG: hypothetical protein LBG50_01180 [Clostridiales Family XIII bacterium]|jgi:hypothetical protein|nr:hypothetical protein [Clostridiales Family XIII bacterium]